MSDCIDRIKELEAELIPLRELQRQLRELMGCDASISVTMLRVKEWQKRCAEMDEKYLTTNEVHALRAVIANIGGDPDGPRKHLISAMKKAWQLSEGAENVQQD